MEHELKIVYKFRDDGYHGSNHVKIYINDQQLPLVKHIDFKCSVGSLYPNITIDFPDGNILFNVISSNITKSIVNYRDLFIKSKIIKSNIINDLKKYINLKAFL